MAVVSIKGDTKDAEKKIKALKQDIDKLDQSARKPKKVNVQTKGIGTSGISGQAGLGSKAMGMAVAGGSLMGGLAATAIQKLVNVLSAAIPALLKFGLGIDNVTGSMSKWSKALEAYTNAPEHALQRADNMDALDDERRAHNSKTLAEEYAWTEAFTNVGGSEFKNQILTRVQSLVEQALGGDLSAIETISKLDRITGTTFSPTRGEEINEYALQSHLGELSTHEIIAEILKNYHGAKESGDYSKVDAMEQLFGRRGMGVVNKLADVGDVERQKDLYVQKWNETHTNESEIMAQAAKAEEIRSLGKVYQYGVPEGGEKYIETGAQNQADTDKLTYEALGSDGSKIQEQAINDLKQDWNKVVDQTLASPLGKAINETVVEPLKEYRNSINSVIDTIDNMYEDLQGLKNFSQGVYKGTGLLDFLESPDATTQLISEKPSPSPTQIAAFGDNAYKPLVESDSRYLPAKEFETNILKNAEGKDSYDAIKEIFNPDTFNQRFYDRYFNNKNKEQPQDKQSEKTAGEVVTALNDVSTNLKNNIAATQTMTNTLKSGLTINGINASGGAASFV